MVNLILGDCLEKMKELDDNSIDSVVCDPPYGLSFMGKKWDYDVPSVEIWEECLRVLKPGGHLLSFSGTRTQHRMAVRIEDAGFEIRDMIAWVYGSGFPKSRNLEGDWLGWGTALKPALEPITMARKPLEGTVAANVLAHGTGALNIDESIIPTNPEIDDSRLGGAGIWSSEKMTKNVYEGGYAGERVGSSPLGRWPANLIHDGSAEVVGLFPVDAKVPSGVAKVSSGRKSGKGTWVGTGMQRPGAENTGVRDFGDTGSAARFFYCPKTAKRDRGEDNNHPTVKPTDLMRYLCRLVTPPKGIILDPFMGSGSTGKAALLEGFSFIGIEMDEVYFNVASKRINEIKNKPSLENFFE